MIEGMFSNVNVNKRDKQNGEIIMLTSYHHCHMCE
jgi:hypothetical protein